MVLDGLMFDNLFLSPFVDGILRDFYYVHPCIFDLVVMSVLIKGGGVFEVIGRVHTKNWVLLC